MQTKQQSALFKDEMQRRDPKTWAETLSALFNVIEAVRPLDVRIEITFQDGTSFALNLDEETLRRH